jgi:predicted TPR repeat methyltransferase
MPLAFKQALARECCGCKQQLPRERFGKGQYERFAKPMCIGCVECKLRKTGKLYGAEQQPDAIDAFDSVAGAMAYSAKPHIRVTQLEMSERALELVGVPKLRSGRDTSALVILDVGCGHGISSDVVQSWGHSCVGTDISQCLLKLAQKEREVISTDGVALSHLELSCQDICQGVYCC